MTKFNKVNRLMRDQRSASPAYDGNGNLTSDGTLTYGYDVESRLGSIVQGSTTLASYAYDPQSRRKSKTVGATTTVFVTDADNREVLEYDGSSGAVQRWYSEGPGLNAALNQMNVAAGTRTTLIPDIQGSVVATLDSGTGALTKAAFLPYGENPTTTTGTFRYAGARIDPETGGTASQCAIAGQTITGKRRHAISSPPPPPLDINN